MCGGILEEKTRVGRLYSVQEPSLDIFYDLPQGTGFCLGQLASDNKSQLVQMVRAKIGYGIQLSREPDGVWVYNRSCYPIFIKSATLDNPDSRTLLVHKYSPAFPSRPSTSRRREAYSGPTTTSSASSRGQASPCRSVLWRAGGSATPGSSSAAAPAGWRSYSITDNSEPHPLNTPPIPSWRRTSPYLLWTVVFSVLFFVRSSQKDVLREKWKTETHVDLFNKWQDLIKWNKS